MDQETKYRVNAVYTPAKILKPECIIKLIQSEPPSKWVIFFEELKTFFYLFMMFFCFAIAIVSASKLLR